MYPVTFIVFTTIPCILLPAFVKIMPLQYILIVLLIIGILRYIFKLLIYIINWLLNRYCTAVWNDQIHKMNMCIVFDIENESFCSSILTGVR